MAAFSALKSFDKAHEFLLSARLAQVLIAILSRERVFSTAGGATGLSTDVDLMKLHDSCVVSQQAIGQQSFFKAGKIFDRFGRLDRADGAGDGAENAGLLAIQDFFGWRRLSEKTAIASALAGHDSHRLSLQPNDSGMGKGNVHTERQYR